MPSRNDDSNPIKVGTTDPVSALDPAGAYDAGSWALFNNLYQQLLTFTPNSTTPTGDAAKSCKFATGDLTTYSCVVRNDITFSNGDKMTAQDVKFSIGRVLSINDPQGPASLFSTVKSIDASGQTVTFHLNEDDATFPLKLATGAGAIVDHREYPADKLRTGNTVVGSGPYLLKQYRSGKVAELAPNTKYHGSISHVGVPVEVDYFSTPQQLSNAWKDKQVDVAHRQLPPSQVAKVDTNDENVRVTESASEEIRNMVFNLRKNSPMSNSAVRQAVANIIDRNQITSSVYDSTVEPLYSVIPQGITSHTTPFFDDYPKPNVPKAKQLLQNAGVHTPVQFTFGYSPGGAAGAEAAEIKRQLEDTGLFKVKVIGQAWTTFQKSYSKGDFDAFAIGWLPDYPDPDDFIAPLVGSDSTFHNDYNSDAINTLITSTGQYSDRSQTSGDFQAIQQRVADDLPLLPLWQRKDYVLSSEDITGSQYLSDGTGIWRLWELSRV
jgi:peptide/nickel transport system substrate-binding protein